MDVEESINISAKTRIRAEESILKEGYKNGAADGQSNIYQGSFDKGYEDGLKFGFDIGYHNAYNLDSNSSIIEDINEANIKNFNCQICKNNLLSKDDVSNLINQQKESNEYFLTCIRKKENM